MDPTMYLIMASPSTTPMSPGKLAAQAAHAAVEAWLISDQNKQVVNRWRCGLHYKKIVLMTDDLGVASRYIQDRGFKVACIIDEGHTEFTADLTMTAIGVEILDKDELHVRETFGAFELYAEEPEFKAVSKAEMGALAQVADETGAYFSNDASPGSVPPYNSGRIISAWGRGRAPWMRKRKPKTKLWDGYKESPTSSSNNPEAHIVY